MTEQTTREAVMACVEEYASLNERAGSSEDIRKSKAELNSALDKFAVAVALCVIDGILIGKSELASIMDGRYLSDEAFSKAIGREEKP